MKTQTDRTQESQNSITPRVASESSNGGTAQLKDNRTSSLDQRKLRSGMDSTDSNKNPIQKKPHGSDRFQQIALTMGKQYGVDTSGLKATHNSSFPAKMKAEATIQGSKIHFAPSKDTDYNIRHEVAHAIDNTLNGTPIGDKMINGQRVDTTREQVVDHMAKIHVPKHEEIRNKVNDLGNGIDNTAEKVFSQSLVSVKDNAIYEPVQRTVAYALRNQPEYVGHYRTILLPQGMTFYHGTKKETMSKLLEYNRPFSIADLDILYPKRQRGGAEIGEGFYTSTSWNQVMEYDSGYVLEFKTVNLLKGEELDEEVRKLSNENKAIWDENNDFLSTPFINKEAAGLGRRYSKFPNQHKFTDQGIKNLELARVWIKSWDKESRVDVWEAHDPDVLFFMRTPIKLQE